MGRSPWIVFLACLSGCGRCSERAPDPAPDPACASACAALSTAGCDGPGELTHASDCQRACEAKSTELAPARCDAERRAYLGCVSTAEVECASARCSAAVCLESRIGIRGCEREHQAFSRCIAPCLHAGAEHLTESVHVTRDGCDGCGELARGAPTGSACQAPKVCSEVCCTCPDGRARYRARVCNAGSCAGADACELAQKHGPDPCAPQLR